MIRIIEELSLNAWPALQTITYDGWLVRFANGYTKRANSVNPLYDSRENLENKIQICEDLFWNRSLNAVFKMTASACPNRLDEVLESKGYASIDRTSVQSLNLSELSEPILRTVQIYDRIDDGWLHSFCMLGGHSDQDKATMKQMLGSIVPRACFISLYDQGAVVACGLGVVEREYIGIFDIVTSEHYRRQGYGKQLMLNLLKWGRANGAQYAYLQVMLSNYPALNLYSKLGFEEVYQYWYRIRQR